MNFLSAFIIVLSAVVLAVPGFALQKAKLLPERATNTLAVLLLYISQPFLVMNSLLGKTFSPSMLPNFAAVVLLAIALQFAVYYIAKLAFCRVKNDAERRSAVVASYLGNVGFMGIPVMRALFPANDAIVLYTVVFNVVFNAMSWTHSVYAITGDKSKVKPYKIILNPPTIATLVALPFFFCNVAIPSAVQTTVGYLGDMTLPLSMIILGIRLAGISCKDLFNRPSVYGVAAVKLIVSPLVALAVMLLVRLIVPLDYDVITALYVIFAMPSASSALNFSEMFGGDSQTAAKATLLNTLLSILTIPVLMMLLKFV